jgi:GT2 family glycosyltransferase/ADP-heptose:LPS heptosyltransferase
MRKFKTAIKFYLHLARLSWEILRLYGVKGLYFAVNRYFKKIKGERLQDYPWAQDYTKGLVTVAILTKNRLDLIKPCLEAIYKFPSSKYEIEILIGDTGTTDSEVWQCYQQAANYYKNLRIIRFISYSFSKNYNRLVENQARGQYVVLLNNDTLVTAHWLDNLIDPLEDNQIGIVGAKLLFPDDTIQHAGLEFNEQGNGFHIYAKQPRDLPEANYKALVPAVTFACAAMRHDVFDRFQLDDDFKEEAQDTDFCFRLTEAGFKVLYNPAAEIYHFECSSRDWRKGKLDRLRLRRIWAQKLKSLQDREQQRRAFDEQEFSTAITIIRDDGIGDLLMGICAFRKLRDRYPEKKLILATYQRNIEMVAGFKIFDQFIAIPDGRKHSPLPIPRASQVYDFVGLEMEFETFWGIMNEDNQVNRHWVYTRELGLEPDYKLGPMPEYPEARRRVRQMLLDLKVDLGQRFAVLCLIASNPARSWWEPYYPQLLEALKAMGLTPLVVGTRNSKYFQGQGIVNLAGKTQAITEYIEAVKLGKYVISTDTSAYHIAALSRIPFLAIFTGGVKPEARLNFYTNYEVVEPPASLSCYPCWDVGCKDLSVRWRSDPCRLLVTPEEVIKKFTRLMSRFPYDQDSL